jgi:hypothetical protein
VEVLSAAEVLSTLDASSALEALPFMPEMLAFCGLAFQVQIRADRTCVRSLPPGEVEPIRALGSSVVLDGLRCDGSAHGGCQLGCMLLWKERWLRRLPGPPALEAAPAEAPQVVLASTREDGTGAYFCQGTELGRATRRSRSKWNPLEYVGLVCAGTFSVPQVVRMLHYAGMRKVRLAVRARLPRQPALRHPETEVLDLQAGEWVEVRSAEEVHRTLDDHGSHRGLTFSGDMYAFCGQRLQVRCRVHTILAEESGRLRRVRDTVILEGCDCRKYMGCARQMPLLWREAWLRRVPGPLGAAG